jgi:tRNA pseudouridine55 synthase
MSDVSKILPGTGRGTARRVVEGHVPSRAPSEAQENWRVPLHHASHGPPPRAGEVS